jgi:hypothetical protein
MKLMHVMAHTRETIPSGGLHNRLIRERPMPDAQMTPPMRHAGSAPHEAWQNKSAPAEFLAERSEQKRDEHGRRCEREQGGRVYRDRLARECEGQQGNAGL